jgi:autotransporter-associated beta strand protein
LAANSANALNFGGLSASLGSAGSYTYSGTLTPNGSTYILGGGGGLLTVSGPLNGANALTVQNGGNVALTNTGNSYSGGTTINSGTSLLISADRSAGGNAELGLVPSSASTNITINGGTLVATASFTLNSNRGIALGASGGTIDVDGVVNLNTFIYGGVISGTSGGSLTLTDTSTLVLSGPNSYNGATNINSGTLRAGAVNTLPQMSAVALGLGGTLQLNGFSQSIGSLTGGGVVTNNSSTSATFTVGNDGTSPASFYGVLSDTTASNTGTLALTKVGDGIMALSGLNTYSGGTTVSDGTLATVGGGTLGSGSLRISAADSVFSNVSIGATQRVSSLTNSATANGLTLLSVASGTTLTSTGALTNTGTLNIGAAGYTGTLIIDGAPTFNANSKLQLTTGTLEFNATSGTATVQSGVTATVAAGATLQLAGTVSALSNGSAAVNITNNGSTASGGGLLVTGANQTVGTVVGNATTSGGATTYGGDTVVAAGASLTATQILQNTLTIGAGATVTIQPSGTGVITQPVGASDAESTSLASMSASSQEIQRLQNRIAILEQLQATESASSASPLDESSPALLASTAADPAGSVDPTILASEIATLLEAENRLLAENDSLSSGIPSGSAGFSSSDSSFGGNAVPEPSGLILVLIGTGLAGFCAIRREKKRCQEPILLCSPLCRR